LTTLQDFKGKWKSSISLGEFKILPEVSDRKRRQKISWVLVLILVILCTCEAKIRKIVVQGQPEK
jgi:hypothetical protein